jgi:hypothetical protein
MTQKLLEGYIKGFRGFLKEEENKEASLAAYKAGVERLLSKVDSLKPEEVEAYVEKILSLTPRQIIKMGSQALQEGRTYRSLNESQLTQTLKNILFGSAMLATIGLGAAGYVAFDDPPKIGGGTKVNSSQPQYPSSPTEVPSDERLPSQQIDLDTTLEKAMSPEQKRKINIQIWRTGLVDDKGNEPYKPKEFNAEDEPSQQLEPDADAKKASHRLRDSKPIDLL